MLFGLVSVQIWLVCVVQGIDNNERLGRCIPGFDVSSILHYTSNEGVWFPQYRKRQLNNKRYSCHILYEWLKDDKGKTVLQVDSWYTKYGKPHTKPSFGRAYTQEKRGVLVDVEQLGKNFIINLTPEYRVRYVCTDSASASKKDGPVVYIDTRSMTPSYEIIKKAVEDIKKSGFTVVLDRIVQRNCTRPLGSWGYSVQ